MKTMLSFFFLVFIYFSALSQNNISFSKEKAFWKINESRFGYGIYYYYMHDDTVFNEIQYKKLSYSKSWFPKTEKVYGTYAGAIREENNKVFFCSMAQICLKVGIVLN